MGNRIHFKEGRVSEKGEVVSTIGIAILTGIGCAILDAILDLMTVWKMTRPNKP